MNMNKDEIPTLTIKVNGQDRNVAKGANLAGLLGELRLDADKVAIEHNGGLVEPALYASAVLNAGDRLEIVHFVGGG